jgi:hypothetical protein
MDWDFGSGLAPPTDWNLFHRVVALPDFTWVQTSLAAPRRTDDDDVALVQLAIFNLGPMLWFGVTMDLES